MTTNILIVDDHPFFLQGFEQYLKEMRDFEIDTALSVNEAIEKIDNERPDLAMLDVTMHNGGGMAVLKHMRQKYPEVPAMFLTVHIDPEQTLEAIRLGIRGIALKESEPDQIVDAMDTVLAGGKWFAQGVTEPALNFSLEHRSNKLRSDDLLTKRELEIVEFVCQGLRNRQIADKCGLCEGTVKIHLNSVFRKLDISSRSELIVKRDGMRPSKSRRKPDQNH